MGKLAGYETQQTTVVTAAGSATVGTVLLPIVKAPFGGLTVKAASLATSTAVAANGSNYVTVTLIDGGAAGTATTAIGTAGGTTGVTVAPAAFTISSTLDELDSGDYLMAQIVKTGTITEREYSIIVDWVHGKG